MGVVPDFVRIPGERYSFEAIPCTLDAHDRLNGSVGANFQILFWIAVVEFCCAKKVFEWNSLECAGDYGFGVQFLPKDEEGRRDAGGDHPAPLPVAVLSVARRVRETANL